MKKLLIVALILAGCKKEQQTLLVPGNYYHLKGSIFNKVAYQPAQPLLLVDLYIGPNGVPYSHCKAAVNWSAFATKSGGGVAEQTVKGNQLEINGGAVIGDPSVLTWDIPQYDLK